jgi:hypothetical protein
MIMPWYPVHLSEMRFLSLDLLVSIIDRLLSSKAEEFARYEVFTFLVRTRRYIVYYSLGYHRRTRKPDFNGKAFTGTSFRMILCSMHAGQHYFKRLPLCLCLRPVPLPRHVATQSSHDSLMPERPAVVHRNGPYSTLAAKARRSWRHCSAATAAESRAPLGACIARSCTYGCSSRESNFKSDQ